MYERKEQKWINGKKVLNGMEWKRE